MAPSPHSTQSTAKCRAPEAQSRRPNILLILADDMTYTDAGCYGNADVLTPNIDMLAEEGLKFDYCYNSAPMCAPTRMSLYTGIHPVRNGAHPNHSQVYSHIRSLPHLLSPLGYEVALLGKRHYAPKENFPFTFLGGREHDDGDGVDLSIPDASAFIATNQDCPWCLVVASNQPHAPWNRGDQDAYDPDNLIIPPYMVDTSETRRLLTKYYAEITYLDNQVGEILQTLDDHGQAENTIVVFLSEQGSAFPFCKWTCYDMGLHSQAIIRWPKVVKASTTSEALIQYIDFAPTFLEIAGGNAANEDFDGKSLLPLLRGETNMHHRYAFGIQTSKGIHNGPKAFGVRTICDREYRLIQNLHPENAFRNNITENFSAYRTWKEKAEAGDDFAQKQHERYRIRPEFEFYDMQNDPFELDNLIENHEHQDRIRTMKTVLANWMEQQGDLGRETEERALERIVHKTKEIK